LHQLHQPSQVNFTDQSWSRHQCTEPLGTPLFGLEQLRKNYAEPAIMAHITESCNYHPNKFFRVIHKNPKYAMKVLLWQQF